MRQRFLNKFAPAIFICIILSLFYLAGFFNKWNLQVCDLLFTPRTPHPDIVIVAIDDRSLNEVGPWPWNRSIYANFLSNLESYPFAIGMDIGLSERSDATEDKILADQLANTNHVVLPIEGSDISYTHDGILLQKITTPIPDFSSHTKSGLVNVLADPDMVIRQVPLHIDGRGYESLTGFPLAVVNEYNASRNQPAINVDALPLYNGLLKINYAHRPGTFPYYSFSDVLNGRVNLKDFTGKIVLVGTTALSFHDEATTPMSRYAMSGIEIQANAIQTILEGRYLIPENIVITIMTILFLSFAIALFFSRFRFVIATVCTLILIAIWWDVVLILFKNGALSNMIYPPMTILYTYITYVLYRFFQETRQKHYLKKALSYYLSKSVMSEVLSHPDKLSLGGKRQEITVLFSDIAGFTSIAEKLEPEILAGLLNRYLTQMTNIVFSYQGVVDKYIGDAMMVFWNAPIENRDHALQACKAALHMQEKIMQIKKDWRDHGVEDFSVRIGINTGRMVVGNMGSDSRFEYTLLGDNVNIGARLESLNKLYGTNILIAGCTYKEVKDHVVAREIDTVAVKGKENGITVFELRHLGVASPDEQEFLLSFEKARRLYQEGKFKLALKAFQLFQKRYPQDVPTRTYIERCKEFVLHRQQNWDGIYRSNGK